MAQTINTNLSSLTAQRNQAKTQGELSTAINRLSSGLRINSAKDDAAGLAISERFTTQIRGLNQAARNANDGISLSQVAEGALGSCSTNLQRIRELAVQSINSTNSVSDRAALQQEVAQLVSEIQRVGTQTEFNGLKLLDGSFTSQNFQVGANSGQVISVKSIVDARTTALGSNTLTSAGAITTTTAAAAANTVNGVTAESTLVLSSGAGSTGAISWNAGSSAATIASAINAQGNNVGITATASNSASIKNLSVAGNVTFTLNGTAIQANITDKGDLTALASAINGSTTSSGITATFSDIGNKSALTLTTSDGRDVNLQDFLNSAGGTVAVGCYDPATGGVTAAQSLISGGNDSTIVTGKVDLTSNKGAISYASAASNVFGAVSGQGTFTAVATMDISSANGASAALAVIDAALAQISGGRAELGAIQNRFQSTIENLQTTSENLSASRSRIQDADFAAETAALARAQILQQAGTAMIAQANQLPQQVLSLLK